jgi:hypothetical protein
MNSRPPNPWRRSTAASVRLLPAIGLEFLGPRPEGANGKKGVSFSKTCLLYEVCNPEQAKNVLEANGILDGPPVPDTWRIRPS